MEVAQLSGPSRGRPWRPALRCATAGVRIRSRLARRDRMIEGFAPQVAVDDVELSAIGGFADGQLSTVSRRGSSCCCGSRRIKQRSLQPLTNSQRTITIRNCRLVERVRGCLRIWGCSEVIECSCTADDPRNHCSNARLRAAGCSLTRWSSVVCRRRGSHRSMTAHRFGCHHRSASVEPSSWVRAAVGRALRLAP